MKIYKLIYSCIKNLFLVYSSCLQDFMDVNNDSILSERLLVIKYHNSFTKCAVEEAYLDYCFNIPKEVYIDVYLVAETSGLNISECDEVIFNSYFGVLIDMIEQIMILGDCEDYNKMAVVINALFMLEGCLALINDRDYEINKEKIFEKIEELENEKNKQSADVIKSIIAVRKDCQKKVRKISVRSNVY